MKKIEVITKATFTALRKNSGILPGKKGKTGLPKIRKEKNNVQCTN